MTTNETIRIAAVGDLHCRVNRAGHFRQLVDEVNDGGCAVLLLCGDLTDHGQPDEARALADELSRVRVPMVGVLGNHDLNSDQGGEVSAILREGGVFLLDGDHYELKGHPVGFAGTKGFAGGFGRSSLQGFGEEVIKSFVYEAVRESLKLEAALVQVTSPIKIAVTHYAPIRATCEGENPEIMPFLGTSRLGDSIDTYRAAAAFHGHAHYGTATGRTPRGIPVYNVATPVLRRSDQRVRIVEVEARPAGAEAEAPEGAEEESRLRH